MKAKPIHKSALLLFIFLFVQLVEQTYSQSDGKPHLVVQLGHSGKVKSAIFSPDGTLIASNGAVGIIIWQYSTGREIRRIAGDFAAIDFAPDSKTIAAAETTEEVHEGPRKTPFLIEIFDVRNGAIVTKFPTHNNIINSVKFSNDGNSILTSSDDHSAKLWNVASGSLQRSFIGHKSEVSCAVFSPDNEFVATSGTGKYDFDKKTFTGDSSARIWDTKTGKQVNRLVHQDAQVLFEGVGFLKFSPDGKILLTSAKPYFEYSLDAVTIRMWNWKTGQMVSQFVGKGTVDYSPDGKYLLADIAEKVDEHGSIDQDDIKGIELIELGSGAVVSRFDEQASNSQIGSLSFSPDGKTVLVATGTIYSGGSGIGDIGENSLRVYEPVTGKQVYDLGQNIQQIKQLKLSRDDKYLLAGDSLWNMESGGQVGLENFSFNNLEKEFNFNLPTRDFSADGKILVESIADEDGKTSGFQLWNVETGKQIGKIFTDNFLANVYIPNGNQFLITESGGSVCSWRVSDAKKVWCVDTSDDYSEAAGDTGFFEVSPDEKIIFIRNRINSLMAVDLVSGRTIWQIPIEMLPFPGIFSSGNRYIIVPTFSPHSEFLSFLDIKTGKELFKIEASHYSDTNNKNILIAYQASKKQHVLIDRTNGKLIASLPKQFSYLEDSGNAFSTDRSNFCLSSDSNRFLSARGQEIRLYDVRSGKLLRVFKGHNHEVTQVMFYKNDDFIISSSLDGTTRLWDVKSGKELCDLISFDDGVWFVSAPDGRFDTNNLESNAGLQWIVADDPLHPLPVEIFMRQYYEPHLLSRILKCTEENRCETEFRPLPDIADINRVQPKIEKSAPNVSSKAWH